MSLKAFHIFFITISTLLALGLGAWSLQEYRRVGGGPNLILSIGSLLFAVLLIGYGSWFVRKIRGLDES